MRESSYGKRDVEDLKSACFTDSGLLMVLLKLRYGKVWGRK